MTLLLGIFAVMVTPREEEPQINVTMADVLIPFPGAAVRDVAQMVAGAGTNHRRRARDVGVAARPGRHHRAVQGGRAAHRDAGAAVYRCALERGLAAEITQRRPGRAGPSIKPKGIDDVPIVTLTLFSKNTGPAPLTWSGLPTAASATSSVWPAPARSAPSVAPAAR